MTGRIAPGTRIGSYRIDDVIGEGNQLPRLPVARRIEWSRDGRSLYASLSDVDADIVMLSGAM